VQTFDQALFELVNDERVDTATALSYATRPQDFKLLVAGGGVLGTSIDQVEQLDAAGALRLRCSDRVDISANGLQEAVTRGTTTGSEQVTSFRKALASDGRRLGPTGAGSLPSLLARGRSIRGGPRRQR
jgi:hypothetical protein